MLHLTAGHGKLQESGAAVWASAGVGACTASKWLSAVPLGQITQLQRRGAQPLAQTSGDCSSRKALGSSQAGVQPVIHMHDESCLAASHRRF